MALFQEAIIKKHLLTLDAHVLDSAYNEYKRVYSPEKIKNIRVAKEEQYQEGFIKEIFGSVLGYPGDFRAPQEFINGYYIEANIESNIKFSNLKKLLSIFELEDELIIKYSSEQSAGADRFTRRRKFWEELLPLLNHHILYTKVNPTKDFWLSAGAGISGLSYNLIITKSYAAIELTLNSASKEENKRLFNAIEKHRAEIEKNFGKPILWETMLESKMSRIKHQLDHVNFYLDSDLETMKTFFVQNLSSFYEAFNPVINGLKKK